jgi:fucose permease
MSEKSINYEGLLLELYKENQTFLNKLIISISTVAIPLIFKAIDGENIKIVSWFFIAGLVFFIGVIFTQIYGLKTAQKGCDKSLSSDVDEQRAGSKLFEKARFFDNIRDVSFMIALILIACAITIKVLSKEDVMTAKDKNTDNQSTQMRESFVPPENMQSRSFTPPKSIEKEDTKDNSDDDTTNE